MRRKNARKRRDRGDDAVPVPKWVADDRQLWFRGRLLHEFSHAAPFETAILAAFEACCWVHHVADPIPAQAGDINDDAKDRLQNAIRNLNRKLPRATIHFRGDGTGRGVRWEYGSVRRRRGGGEEI